jgi:hypothetical protein
MPYTRSGFQRGGNYGDYYRGDYYRGDPGLFGSIFKAVGGAVKGFIGGGPIGAVLGGARAIAPSLFQPRAPGTAVAIAPPPPIRMPIIGPLGGQVQTGGLFGGVQVQQFGGTGGKRAREYIDPATGAIMRRPGRRMNVANSKALRRALRRVAGFGKLAKRARRDIARAASAVGVRRGGGGGSRGVITRSEAARALRR